MTTHEEAQALLTRFYREYPSVEQWRQKLAREPMPRAMHAPVARDIHRYTVYHNEQFQTLMDEVYGPRWRGWPFQLARRYAKTFNHAAGPSVSKFSMGRARLLKLLGDR